MARNAKPLDAPINGFSAVNGHYMSTFSKVIGLKTVRIERVDVYTRKRKDFASNSVIGKSPNLMDLGLSPAHTTDKIKSVISPTTRVEGLKMDLTGWLLGMVLKELWWDE